MSNRPQALANLNRSIRLNQCVFGLVVGRVDGGLTVDVGVQAVIHDRDLHLHVDEAPESLIGQVLPFKVLSHRYNRSKNLTLLTRNPAALAEDVKDDPAACLEVGQAFDGVVTQTLPFGVEIQLSNGMVGLLRVEDQPVGANLRVRVTLIEARDGDRPPYIELEAVAPATVK